MEDVSHAGTIETSGLKKITDSAQAAYVRL
jgi:hypothetical protein